MIQKRNNSKTITGLIFLTVIFTLLAWSTGALAEVHKRGHRQVRKVTTKFAEVKIALNDRFSLADIGDLLQAPGSDLQILDNGKSIRVNRGSWSYRLSK